MPNTLLIVCTANVCRSQLASAVIRSHRPRGWVVLSAGTQARDGEPGCAQAASRQPAVRDRLARHLRAEDVERADLILTAEREHRSAVTRLLPSARPRTFTLREFDLLAEQFGVVSVGGASDGNPNDTDVRQVFAVLDRRRPTLVVPTTRGELRHRLGLVAADPGMALDVVDGHRHPGGRHRRTLDDVEALAERIARLLDRRSHAPVVAPSATTLFGRGRHRDGSGDRWHNGRPRGAAGGPGGC